MLPHMEAFYGGAARGGKSDALLMGALMYVDYPGYAALMLRRTYPQLAMEGGLLEVAHKWLDNTPAQWSEKHLRWRFPSGASLTFSHLHQEDDKFRYQGSAFQYIAFDELTHFSQRQYEYMFTRLVPSQETPELPIRIRAAGNPGGFGHEWVKSYFNLPKGRSDRPFIPARLTDNYAIDHTQYRQSLSRLDPITRQQMEHGDWTVRDSSGFFRRENFEIVDKVPAGLVMVRSWDQAATKKLKTNDPARTAGVKMAYDRKTGFIYICHSKAFYGSPGEVERVICHTADSDGPNCDISIPQDPGQAGKGNTEHYAKLLMGYTFESKPETGSKIDRARPFAGHVHQGLVKIKRGPWNEDYLDEVEGFPGLTLKDQVDASSNGFVYLSNRPASIVGPGSARRSGGTSPVAPTAPSGRASRHREQKEDDVMAAFEKRQASLSRRHSRQRRNPLDGFTPDG